MSLASSVGVECVFSANGLVHVFDSLTAIKIAPI